MKTAASTSTGAQFTHCHSIAKLSHVSHIRFSFIIQHYYFQLSYKVSLGFRAWWRPWKDRCVLYLCLCYKAKPSKSFFLYSKTQLKLLFLCCFLFHSLFDSPSLSNAIFFLLLSFVLLAWRFFNFFFFVLFVFSDCCWTSLHGRVVFLA